MYWYQRGLEITCCVAHLPCRKQLDTDPSDVGTAAQQLRTLQQQGVQLATRSLRLLAMSDNPARQEFVNHSRERGSSSSMSYITCMDVLKKAIDEVSMLLYMTTDSAHTISLTLVLYFQGTQHGPALTLTVCFRIGHYPLTGTKTCSGRLIDTADHAPQASLTYIPAALLAKQSHSTSSNTTLHSCMQPDAVSQLILGTEDKRILILNVEGTAVEKSFSLPAVPAFLATAGELDVGYRITVAARDGRLYNIKSGSLSKSVIQLDSQPVGVVSAAAGYYQSWTVNLHVVCSKPKFCCCTKLTWHSPQHSY